MVFPETGLNMDKSTKIEIVKIQTLTLTIIFWDMDKAEH